MNDGQLYFRHYLHCIYLNRRALDSFFFLGTLSSLALNNFTLNFDSLVMVTEAARGAYNLTIRSE